MKLAKRTVVRSALIGLSLFLAACSTAPKTQQLVSLPSAPPPGELSNVLGLDANAVRLAYGAPSFVRHDGAAEMWRYDGASCHAFFFLYAQGGVRHVETLPHGANIAADTNCLSALRARAGKLS